MERLPDLNIKSTGKPGEPSCFHQTEVRCGDSLMEVTEIHIDMGIGDLNRATVGLLPHSIEINAKLTHVILCGKKYRIVPEDE